MYYVGMQYKLFVGEEFIFSEGVKFLVTRHITETTELAEMLGQCKYYYEASRLC